MGHAEDALDDLPDGDAGPVLHSYAVLARFRRAASDAGAAERLVRDELVAVRGLFDDVRVLDGDPWLVDVRFVVASVDGETAVDGVHTTLRETGLAPDEAWVAEQLP